MYVVLSLLLGALGVLAQVAVSTAYAVPTPGETQAETVTITVVTRQLSRLPYRRSMWLPTGKVARTHA
jgi:hypothetical protein